LLLSSITCMIPALLPGSVFLPVAEDAFLGIDLGRIQDGDECALRAGVALVAAAAVAGALVHLNVGSVLRVAARVLAVVLVAGGAVEGAAAKDEVDEGLEDGDAAGDDDCASFDTGNGLISMGSIGERKEREMNASRAGGGWLTWSR
jgi:hypothetical protein